MPTGSKGTVVAGDVHGNWKLLNKFSAHRKPSLIIQCGDFGYWPSLDGCVLQPDDKHPWKQNGQKLGDAELLWIDGNHEDHLALQSARIAFCRSQNAGRGTNIQELPGRIIYQDRGSNTRLPNGEIALFMGGAQSVDRHMRTFGVDWFPEETISNADLENALSGPAPDIVFSHTCPNEFLQYVMPNARIEKDPSRDALSVISKEFRPTRWYFAHWHKYATGTYGDCKWTCLAELGEPGGWEYLY